MEKKEQIRIISAVFFPFILVLICWLVWYWETITGNNISEYGIQPKSFTGLRGILFAPFLHDTKDISHILNNTTPLLFLGWATFYFYREIAFKILISIWILSGFWVWMVASADSYHIGASGILYGLASFLFYSGLIRRQSNLMGLTLLVTFLYGGMIWGIFPYDIRISWQSHLFGGLAGLIMAIYFRKTGWQRTKYDWEKEVVTESFSELNKRHEDVLEGKLEEPNEEEKKEDGEFRVNYEYKPKG